MPFHLFFVFSNFRVFVIGFRLQLPGRAKHEEAHENTKQRKHEKMQKSMFSGSLNIKVLLLILDQGDVNRATKKYK